MKRKKKKNQLLSVLQIVKVDRVFADCSHYPFTKHGSSVKIFTENEKKKDITTCIKKPLKGSNESGLLQQVVFKYRFY